MARRRRAEARRQALGGALALPGLLACALPAWSMPQDGTVAAGSATISQPTPNRMEIRQSSPRAVIDWRGFSIGQGEQVSIQQPSTSAIALNRVTGPDASRIDGKLTANGQVWLINPNGVMVGPTGRVDVSGLVATTANISNSDFMAGRHRFDQPGKPGAAVANEGQITVAEGGIGALVAPSVRNAGQIEARLGKVALAAGDRFTLDLHGDRLVNIAISDATAARLENSGQIVANGGTVTLSAAAAREAVSEVVNTGVVQARSVAQRGGVIVLDAGAGQATVAGMLDASGRAAGETGGTVTVAADAVALTGSARIDVSGDAGGGAAFIGGGVQGNDPAIRNASAVAMAHGARIDVSATRKGKGGKAVLWSEKRTAFDGEIAARGGAEAGDGGFVETSSRDLLQAFGNVDAAAPLGRAGDWLLDPKDVELRAAGTANGSFTGGIFNPDDGAGTPAVIDVATIRTALNGGTSVTINTTSTFPGNGDITVIDAVTRTAGNGAATLTLNAARNINVNAGISRAAGGNGALNLTFNAAGGSINLAAGIDVRTNNGTVALNAANGAVTQSGGSLKAASLAVTAANSSSLTQSGNDVATVAARITGSGQGLSYMDANAVAVGAVSGVNGVTASGDLTLNAGGAITQSRALTVGGSTSIGTGAAAITLTQSNQLTGAVSLSNSGANNVSLTNGRATMLGASTVGGNLTVSASGAISQAGALAVGGTSSFAAGGNGIALTEANQLAGAISLSNSGANDVSLRNDRATVLGASTVGRNLSVNAAGALSQTGALTVAGTSSFDAGTNTIALTAANQLTGAASLNNGGASNVSLTNNRATVLAGSTVGGNLAVTANGAITQTGALSVAGTSSFAAGGNAITLTQANQLAGAVSLSNSGPRDVALTNAMATLLGAATIGRNLTVSAAGTLSQVGVLTVGGTSSFNAGANAIALTQANRLTGAISLNNSGASNVSLVNDRATVLGASTVGGDLAVSADGAITQTGVLTVAGSSSFATGAAAITLTQANQLAGAVSLSNSGNNNVSLTNTRATVLGSSTIGRDLTVSAAGLLSQTGALSVGGTSSFNAGANAIALTQANQLTGAVSLTNSGANDALLSNNRATVLAASTVGGNLAVNAAGAITQTGVLNVAGSSSFATDAAAITLTRSNQLAGAVSLSNSGASNVSLTNGRATVLGSSTVGGNLAVTATGAISQTGALSVEGTSSFAAGANAIALTQANQLTGAVSLSNSGANDVSLTNARTTVLGSSTVGRNLAVTATSGDITQSSGTVSVAGNALLAANAGAVTQTGGTLSASGLAVSAENTSMLNQATNNVTTLAASISGAGQGFQYTDTNAVTVGSVGGVNGIAAAGDSTVGATQFQNTSAISLGVGAFTVTADAALIGASILANGGITIQPRTVNRAINLGSGIAGDAALNLGGTELANLSTAGLLTFGRSGGTGVVTFNGAALAGNSVLAHGGSIAFSTAGSSFGNLTLTPSTTGSVTVSAALDLSAGGTFTQTTGTQFQNTAAGSINLGGGTLDVTADAALIGGAITANGGITFQPKTLSLNINAGSGISGDAALNFSGAELGLLSTTGTLTLGATAGTGTVTFNGASLAGRSVAARGGSIAFNTAASSFGTLMLNSNGGASTVTQTVALTAGSLGISGAGAVMLDNAGNNLGTLAASGAQSLQVTDADALTIGTVGTLLGVTADVLQLRTLSGDLTIAQPVSATALSGDSLVLAAGGNLVNTFGPTALSTAGSARFLVYGSNPAGTVLGGLTAPAKLYNRSFAGTPPASVPGTGSTFLYSVAPTLTVNADAISREYGLANPPLTFAASGFIDGDSAATALAGTLSTSASILSNVGSYSITQGTLASLFGYSLVFTGASLDVTPAPLTVIADDKAREFGQANPTLTASFSGLRNGDSGAVVTGLSLATAATAASPAGAYAISSSGGSAANYAITSRVDGTLTVTAAVPATVVLVPVPTPMPSASSPPAPSETVAAGPPTIVDAIGNTRQVANDRGLATPSGDGFAARPATPGEAAQRGGGSAGGSDPFRLSFALGNGPAAGLGEIAPAAGGEAAPAADGGDLEIDAFLSRWWEWRAALERAAVEPQ